MTFRYNNKYQLYLFLGLLIAAVPGFLTDPYSINFFDEPYQILNALEWKNAVYSPLASWLGHLFGDMVEWKYIAFRYLASSLHLAAMFVCGFFALNISKYPKLTIAVASLATLFMLLDHSDQYLYNWDSWTAPVVSITVVTLLSYIFRPCNHKIFILSLTAAVATLLRLPNACIIPFLMALLAVYVFHNSAFIDPQDLISGIDNVSLGIWSFFTGGITLIDKFCGTQFLWFLPTFLSMSLIRSWYSTKNLSSLVKVLLFTVGTGCYVIYFVIRYGVPFYPVEFSLITQAVSPISVFEGLGYFTLGMGVMFLIKRLNFNRAVAYWGVLLVITILYLLFNPYQLPFRIIKFFFPIVVFLALFSSKEWFGRFNILRKFGARSLAIYLIHVFLCMIAGMVIPKELLNNPGVLVLEFFVIAGLSYILALLIDRISLLRILLFPKGEEIGIKFNRR